MQSRDLNSWMWAEALELLQNAEQLQRQFFQLGELRSALCWEPPVDLYEIGDELRILVALPGVAVQRLEVVLEAAAILIRAERMLPRDLQCAAIHRLEIPYGLFERRVQLPAGRFQLFDQRLEDGCLALGLRRMA
jgi:Molecular chaperone (small heat shock protein)